MPKLIKLYKDDRIVISQELAMNLDFDELALLIKMFTLDDSFDCSAENIAKHFHKGKSAINNSLKAIESEGYLYRRRVFEGNRIKDWEYIFSNHKLTDSEKQNCKSEDIHSEDIQNRDVVKNNEFFDADEYLDSSINLVFAKKEREKDLVSSDSVFNKYVEYENMLISEHDLYELEKAMKASLTGEIDASKSNVIKYAQKMYDPSTKTFRTKYGEKIKSLYKFITKSFNYKTEQDKAKEEDKLQLSNGYKRNFKGNMKPISVPKIIGSELDNDPFEGL